MELLTYSTSGYGEGLLSGSWYPPVTYQLLGRLDAMIGRRA